MQDIQEIEKLIGKKVYDKDHETIGTLSHLYIDEVTEKPNWATVQLDSAEAESENFFPLVLGQPTEDGIVLEVKKAKVEAAPRYEENTDETLDKADEQTLSKYYGLDNYSNEDATNKTYSNTSNGEDTAESTTDTATTRSEDQLDIKKRTNRSA